MSKRRDAPDFHCPACGHEPGMIIGTEQATCGNDVDCEVIFFNPSLRYTPEDLASAHRVDFGPLTQEAGGEG